MWSGPRTLSTALLRSWGNRADTAVVDEPLYAHYLAVSGVVHPGHDAIVASQPTDWRTVVERLTAGPVPEGRAIYYQKHMTHHVLADIDRSRLRPLRHAFLLRDPRDLLTSYARVRTEPTFADLGLGVQAELFEQFGGPVIDSRDLLRAPGPVLRALCDAVGVEFDPAMLSWPAGPRETDGVWAPYWYGTVRASTGFGPPTDSGPDVPERFQGLLARCLPFYERLAAHRIRVDATTDRAPAEEVPCSSDTTNATAT